VSCVESEFDFASVAFTFFDFVIVTFVIVIVIVAVIDGLYSFNVRQRLESQYFSEKQARSVSVSSAIECDRVRVRVRVSAIECD